MNRTSRELSFGLISLAGFIVVTVLVVSSAAQSFDLNTAAYINSHDLGSLGTSLMVLLSDYGREVVWGALVVGMFLLGNKRTKVLAMELAILFIAGIVFGEAAKILVDRTRPYIIDPSIILRVGAETDPSYPSGHALIVSIGAAFCLATFRKRTVSILLAVEATLVCYSRIYVGVHYPLDIVGGILLGTAIALTGTVLIEKYLSTILEKLLEPIMMIIKNGPVDM